MLERDEGSYCVAKRNECPVELSEVQTLAEREEAWAHRPWTYGKDVLLHSMEAPA